MATQVGENTFNRHCSHAALRNPARFPTVNSALINTKPSPENCLTFPELSAGFSDLFAGDHNPIMQIA